MAEFGFDAVIAGYSNPTSLQFVKAPTGEDLLITTQQDGTFTIWHVTSTGEGTEKDFQAVEIFETNIIKTILNHNDDGSLASGVNNRQVTGFIAEVNDNGEIEIYTTSSDPRIGGGGEATVDDKGIDTNSGVLSKLVFDIPTDVTATGQWSVEKTDLLRGLPRSEENHSPNGLAFTPDGQLLIAIGGFANTGAPSQNLVYTPEYWLSAAILEVDIAAIEAMDLKTDSEGQQYKYDLPTLGILRGERDGDVAGEGFAKNADNPFGGNDGYNQAYLEPGGPVSMFATGFRNTYDLQVIELEPGDPGYSADPDADNFLVYTWDNGANNGWGDPPVDKNGVPVTIENANEADNVPVIENNSPVAPGAQDQLHLVERGGYYGSAAPSRANPDAILYLKPEIETDASNIETNAIPAPEFADGQTLRSYLPPETGGDPLNGYQVSALEGFYLKPTTGGNSPDDALVLNNGSTNGIVIFEYDPLTMPPELAEFDGNLFATGFDEQILRVEFNEDGDVALNRADIESNNSWQDSQGSNPLDVTVGPGGSIWVAAHGGNNIFAFVPGGTPVVDTENDDNDNLNDNLDPFQLDPQNGLGVNSLVDVGEVFEFTMENEVGAPNGLDGFALGFTGHMVNYDTEFFTNESGVVRGGVLDGGIAGKLQIEFDAVGNGTAEGTANSLTYALQAGLNFNDASSKILIESVMSNPWLGADTQAGQSQGIYFGTGTQFDYALFNFGIDADGNPVVQIRIEINDVVAYETEIPAPGLDAGVDADMIMRVVIDRDAKTVTPAWEYETSGGVIVTGEADPISLEFGGVGNSLTEALDGAANGGFLAREKPVDGQQGQILFGDLIGEFGAPLGLAVGVNGRVDTLGDAPGGTPFAPEFDNLLITASDANGAFAPQVASENAGSVKLGETLLVDVADLLSNDSDFDGKSLSIVSVSAPNGGVATLVNGGTQVAFTPDGLNNSGFSYVVSNGDLTAEATASVTVTPPEGEGVVIYRVNAGAGTVTATDGGPDWLGDTAGQPGNVYLTGTAANTFSNGLTDEESEIDLANLAGAPVPWQVFVNERGDNNAGAGGDGQTLDYEFPVEAGKTYSVTVYYTENWQNIFTSADPRIFDVALNGEIVFDNIHPLQEAADYLGQPLPSGSLSDAQKQPFLGVAFARTIVFTAENDTLELSFLHNEPPSQNPKVNAIEIKEIAVDDGQPSVSIADVSVVEGGEMAFQLTLSESVDEPVTVAYEIVPDTATPGVDYSVAGATPDVNGVITGEITFAASSVDASIFIQTNDDDAVTGARGFTINLLAVTTANAALGDAAAAGTIEDNDLADGQVVFAVNSGGGAVDGEAYGLGDADFEADTAGSPNAAFNPVATNGPGSGNNTNANGSGETFTGAAVPDNVFITERWSAEWGYNVDLPDGDYVVDLYFAETFQGVSNTDGVGSRIFDVFIEGQTVVDDLDLYDEGDGVLGNGEGAPLVKIIKSFNATVADGQLNILVEAVGPDAADNAKLSAVVVRATSSVGDTEAPTASIVLTPPVDADSAIVATVTFADDTAFDDATVDAGDLALNGPSTPDSVGFAYDADANVATYTFTPPTGGWVDGGYTATLAAGAVADDAANPIAETGSLPLILDFSPGAPVGFGPSDDLDQDGIVNSEDPDIDGDTVANADETFAYDATNAGEALAAGDVVRFEFDTDGTPFENGLRGALWSPNQPGAAEINLDNASVSGGTLNVSATNGDHFNNNNTQENALVAAFSSADGLRVETRFDAPDFDPTTTDKDAPLDFQAAGLTIGFDQNNMVKAVFGRAEPQFQLVQDNAGGGAPSEVLTDLPSGFSYADAAAIIVSLEVFIDDSGVSPVAKAKATATVLDGSDNPLPGLDGLALGEIQLENELAATVLAGDPLGAGVIQTSTNAGNGRPGFDVSYEYLEITGLGEAAAPQDSVRGEAIGDFSEDGQDPTDVALNPGSNEIVSSQQGEGEPGGRDYDYYTIVVPEGHVLSAINVTDYSGDLTNQAFVGIIGGDTFPAPPASAADFPGLAAQLLGGAIVNTSGVDLLPEMADGAVEGQTTQGFTPPLSAGTYTVWHSQNGGQTTVGLDFVVTEVEADTLLSIADAAPTAETGDDGATALSFAITADDAAFTGQVELQATVDIGDGPQAVTKTVDLTDGAGVFTVDVPNDDEDNGSESVSVTLDAVTTEGFAIDGAAASAVGEVTEDDGVDPADIDGDGVANTDDPFAFDGANGDAKALAPGGEFLQDFNTDTTNPFSAEAGFSGIIVNPAFDPPGASGADPYGDRTTESGVSISGGSLMIDSSNEDLFNDGATDTSIQNTIKDNYQSAADVTGVDTFEIVAKTANPFFNDGGGAPALTSFASFGITLGAGGVNDYVKFVLGGSNGGPRIQIAQENSLTGAKEQNTVTNSTAGGNIDSTTAKDIVFRLAVDTVADTVQGFATFLAADGSVIGEISTLVRDIDPAGSLAAALNGQNPLTGGDGGLAYGVSITDFSGAPTFTGSWDYLRLTATDPITLAIADAAAPVVEAGDDGTTTTLDFALTASDGFTGTSDVDYTVNGEARTATGVAFVAGAAILSVEIDNDDLADGDTAVEVVLTGASASSIVIDEGADTGLGAVTEDDFAPIAVADSPATPANTPITFNPAANDTDADTDPAELRVVAIDTAATTGGTVELNAETGEVTVTPEGDFSGDITFGYTVADPAGNSSAGTATVSVAAPENQAPSAVALENTLAGLSEDADTAATTKIADIVVTDDGLGTNDLSLAGADAGLFEIVEGVSGAELHLKAGVSLDFETQPQLEVTVEVDDASIGGAPDATVDLILPVTDVNEAPSAVTLENIALSQINEATDTSAAIKVADIAVADDALGANVLALSGADADLFEIVGTELFLKAGAALDFETKSTLDVTVEVDDEGVGATPDAQASLQIAVTNAVENGEDLPGEEAGGPGDDDEIVVVGDNNVGEQDAPYQLPNTVENIDTSGTTGDTNVVGNSANNTFKLGSGQNVIDLQKNGGSDTVSGASSNLDGTIIVNAEEDDQIVIEDAETDAMIVSVQQGSTIVTVDPDGDETTDNNFTITFAEDNLTPTLQNGVLTVADETNEPIVIQAEAALGAKIGPSNFYVEPSNAADGGLLIRLPVAQEGSLTFDLADFGVEAGPVAIELTVFDENDGASTGSVTFGGQTFDFTLFEATADGFATLATKRVKLFQGELLADDTTLTIFGDSDDREHFRIDQIRVIPLPEDDVDNLAPAAIPGALTGLEALEDEALVLDLNNIFQDPEEQSLTFTLDPSAPAFVTLDDNGLLTISPTNDDVVAETALIGLTVSDGANTITPSFSVALIAVNDKPEIGDPIANPDPIEAGDLFSYTIPATAFTDVDDETLTLSATLENGDPLPDWLMFDPETGAFSGTPDADDAAASDGALQIAVTATDAGGLFASQTFTLFLQAAPEVFEEIADQEIDQGADFALSIAANFIDVDSEALTYTATLLNGDPLPDWLALDPVAGLFSGAPGNGDVGEIDIVVTATDEVGASVTDAFKLTVANVNDAPETLGVVQDQDASVGEDFTFALPEGLFGDVDLDVEGSGETLTLSTGALPAGLDFDPETGVFSGAPTTPGTSTIVVTATDAGGETTTASFNLNVIGVNLGVPVRIQAETLLGAAIGDSNFFTEGSPAAEGQSLIRLPRDEDGTLVVDLAPFGVTPGQTGVLRVRYFDESDGDLTTATITVGEGVNSWTFNDPTSGGAFATPLAARIREFQVTFPDDTEQALLTLYADSDGSEHARFDWFEFTPTGESGNFGPQVGVPLEDQTFGDFDGVEISLLTAFSDPEEDPLTYTVSGPDWLEIGTDDNGFPILTGISAEAGVFPVTVTATDATGSGASRSQTFQLTIIDDPDGPFLISIADAPETVETGGEGTSTTLAFALAAANPSFEGDVTVTYSLDGGSTTEAPVLVSFAAGAATLNVPVANDDVNDGPTSVEVTLTAVEGELVALDPDNAVATGVVTDDDPALISISDAAEVVEAGDVGTTTALSFALTSTDATFTGQVAVTFSLDGGATTETPQLVDFVDGVGALDVLVDNDDDANGPDLVSVLLTAVEGDLVAVDAENAAAVGSVSEDDEALISIADAGEVLESGDVGTDTVVAFTLTSSDPSLTGDVTIEFSLDNGATAETPQLVSFVDGVGTLEVLAANDDEDNGSETVEVLVTGATGALVAVDPAANTATASVVEDDAAAEPTVVLRINAFGPEVAATNGGPAWQADGNGSPNNEYLSTTDDRGDTQGYSGDLAAIPAGVPETVLDTARSSNAPFSYNIPVADLDGPGTYRVKLYIAELFTGGQAGGFRIFDASLEGGVPFEFDNIDPGSDFGGGNVGVLTADIEVTDGELNIGLLQDLAEGVQNPIVNAIEVLKVPDGPDADAPTASFAITPPANADSDVTVVVTYDDASGVDEATLGDSDVTIVSNDAPVASVVTFVGFDATTGQATYAAAPPTGGWTEGAYAAVVGAGEVADALANLIAETASAPFQIDFVEDTAPATASAYASFTAGATSLNTSTFSNGSIVFQNTSTSGEEITQIQIDLHESLLPFVGFDLASDGDGGVDYGDSLNKDFQVNGATPVSVLGTSVSNPTTAFPGMQKEGGFITLTVDLAGFVPGAQLAVSLDQDPPSIKNGTPSSASNAGAISGLEQVGSSIKFVFGDQGERTAELFTDGSFAGAEAYADADLLAAPTISVTGVSTADAEVDEAVQTVNVTGGPANGQVKVLVVEGGAFRVTNDSPDNGYVFGDFETNKAIVVNEVLVSLDASGAGSAQVTLTETPTSAGQPSEQSVNYIVAAAVSNKDGDANLEVTSLVSNKISLKLVDEIIDPPGGEDFAPDGDLDGDLIINSQDADVDGDGILNVDDSFAYDAQNGALLGQGESIELTFDVDGTIYENGITGFLQGTVNGGAFNEDTGAASVSGGTLNVAPVTNGDTGGANNPEDDVQIGVKNGAFTVEANVLNPWVDGPGPNSFDQIGVHVGLDSLDFLKVVFGFAAGTVEFSSRVNNAETKATGNNQPLPDGLTLGDFASVDVILEISGADAANATASAVLTFLDANGDPIPGAESVAYGQLPITGALAAALADESVGVGVGFTHADGGGAPGFNAQLDSLKVTEGVGAIVDPPADPGDAIEILQGAQGVDSDGSYGSGVVGSAELRVMAGVNTVQSSNFGNNSFVLENTGDKQIAAVFLDFRNAIYGDSVIDFDGSAGDTAAKAFGAQNGVGDTGVITEFIANNAPNGFDLDASYFLAGDTPNPGGNGATGGWRGLLIRFDGSDGGFENGEELGFAGDMDPNSIATITKSAVDSGAVNSWDVGGVSGAELIGSAFTVMFDDGTFATGYLGSDGSQAGSVGKATQSGAAQTATVTVNGFNSSQAGTYGGTEPEIIVNGPANATVLVTLSKGLNPVTNTSDGVADLVAARLQNSQPEFLANNAADFQVFEITLNGSGQATLPPGVFDYNNPDGGQDFNGTSFTPGFETAPIVVAAAVVDGDGFVSGPVDRVYLSNPTSTPVDGATPEPTGGFFQIIGSGNNARFKVQIEDVNVPNGGTDPGGNWTYVEGDGSGGNQSNTQGTGHYYWGAESSSGGLNGPQANSFLEYTIFIPEGEGGVYTFRARSSRDTNEPGDARNDVWLKIDDDAEALQVNSTNSVSNSGFVKLFGATAPNWGFASQIDSVSEDEPNFSAQFNLEPGLHTITLAGRSQGFHIDFWELYKGGAPNTGASNSAFVVSGDTEPFVANALSDQEILEGSAYSFQIPSNVFDDLDGDTLSIDVSAPNGFSVNGSTVSAPGTLAPGDYVITVTATDDDDNSVSDSYTLTVSEQVEPTGNVRIELWETVTDTVLDSNLQSGDTIDPADFAQGQFGLNAVPAAGLSVGSVQFFLNGELAQTENGAPYSLFGNPGATDLNGGPLPPEGPLTIGVVVYSGSNGTGTILASQTVNVAVGSVADTDPFIANPLPDQEIQEGSPYSFQIPSNVFDDLDGDTLSIDVSAPNGFSVNGSTVSAPGTLAPGDYVITVTATDDDDNSVSDSYTLTVSEEIAPTGQFRLELLNPATEALIVPDFGSGDVLDPADFPSGQFALRAVPTTGVSIGSVHFFVNGEFAKQENAAPYSLFGDNGASDLLGGPVPSEGPLAIQVVAYSGANGTGSVVASQTFATTVGASDDGAQTGAAVWTAATAADDIESLGSVAGGSLEFGENSQAVSIRFTGSEIPTGAVVTNAYFVFEALSSRSGDVDLQILIEDTLNAAPYTTGSQALGRSTLPSSVAWNNLPSWFAGQSYQSPDVSSLLNALIAGGGLGAGDAIAFRFETTGGPASAEREAFAAATSGDAPQLVIEYQVPSSALTPVVLDLNGDGAALLGVDEAQILFDYDSDGVVERGGWIDPTDGFLAIDRDGDGRITSGAELSFLEDLPGSATDLEGLRAFDDDANGAIDASDAAYDSLLVWRDVDSDGRSDAGELMGLAEAGIVSIALDSQAEPSPTQADGNIIFGRTTATLADGGSAEALDAGLYFEEALAGFTMGDAKASPLPEPAGGVLGLASFDMSGMQAAMPVIRDENGLMKIVEQTPGSTEMADLASSGSATSLFDACLEEDCFDTSAQALAPIDRPASDVAAGVSSRRVGDETGSAGEPAPAEEVYDDDLAAASIDEWMDLA